MKSNNQCVVDPGLVFYHLPMTWQEVWGILKWVLAALAAGFIGQFGKSLALYLLRRRRMRRGEEAEAQDVAPTSTDAPSAETSANAEVEKARLDAVAKIEKKRAKAEVKRLKKS